MSDPIDGLPRSPGRWRMEFYSERRGALVSCLVEAPTPAAAVPLGLAALCGQHPPARSRRRPSLFERARRIGGEDDSGWILHRIVRES